MRIADLYINFFANRIRCIKIDAFLKTLQKRWTIISVSLGNSFLYRSSFFMRLLVLSLTLTVQFLFWKAALSSTQEIANYNFKELISYLLVANLIYEFLQPNDVMLANQIREGELNKYLLLPFSLIDFTYWKFIGNRLAFLISSAIPLFVCFFIFNYFNILSVKYSIMTLLLGGTYIIGGLLIHFHIEFGIGLFAFWFERSDFLVIMKEIVFRILVGLWFPLEILPKMIRTGLDWLPFQFLGYTPAKAIIDPSSVGLTKLYLLLIWIVLLCVVNSFILKFGVKKYQAYGC